MSVITPGMRIECRNAEWLVTRVESSNTRQDLVVYCAGADDLTRGHESAFLTQLERIVPVDPSKTDNKRGHSP